LYLGIFDFLPFGQILGPAIILAVQW
jgi:hypothetical protein